LRRSRRHHHLILAESGPAGNHSIGARPGSRIQIRRVLPMRMRCEPAAFRPGLLVRLPRSFIMAPTSLSPKLGRPWRLVLLEAIGPTPPWPCPRRRVLNLRVSVVVPVMGFVEIVVTGAARRPRRRDIMPGFLVVVTLLLRLKGIVDVACAQCFGVCAVVARLLSTFNNLINIDIYPSYR